jgi:hypothetical protein
MRRRHGPWPQAVHRLVIELAETAFAVSPAEHYPESSVCEEDWMRCRHVQVETAGCLDTLEKEVSVSLRCEGMDFNVGLNVIGVERIKVRQLLKRVMALSIGIEFSAHGMVLDGQCACDQSSEQFGLSNRRKAKAMERAGPIFAQRGEMFRSGVSLVPPKSVLRIERVQLVHDSVTSDFRDDARGGDGQAQGVASDHRGLWRGEVRDGESIDQDMFGW